jgi:hypothetical protein
MPLFRRRNEENMDGEVIDLAAMERGSRKGRRKRVGKNEYEHLVEHEAVVRMPSNAPSFAHPSVWAQTQAKSESAESENAAWRDVVEVLAELRVQIEAYRKDRLEFELWARVERAAIEQERRALQAEARALAEELGRNNESD